MNKTEYQTFFKQLRKGHEMGKAIVIDGTVGSGKSSLAQILEELQTGYKAYYEPVEDNPILEKFYYDRERYSFPLQVFFLNKRFKMVQEANKTEGSILDRGIYGDMVFAKMLWENGEMSDEEYNLYKDLACNMLEHIEPPKLMIYLKNSVDCAINKINKRGRDYELATERAYWERLNGEYEQFFEAYDISPLLVIDIEDLDFVNNEDDKWTVLGKIFNALNEIERGNK